MINISVADAFVPLVEPQVLEQAAWAVLCNQSILDSVELSIVVEQDEQLKELNRQFRDVDAPTDVLSFPADEVDPDSGARYLGDVIISYPMALKQADAVGHPVTDELRLLTVHGVLHLLGYDHADEAEKEEMWRIQDEVLASLAAST